MKTRADRTEQLLYVLLISLPWWYPFARGPSPAVQPWLLSLACGVMLWRYRRHLSVELILQGWILAASISSVIGLLQYAGVSGALAPWVVATPPGAAFGNLRQPNQFATLTNIALASLLWIPLRAQTGRAWRKTGMVLIAVLLASANAASASRTGMTQLLLLAGVVAIWGQWRQSQVRLLLGTALSTYVLASLLLPMLVGLDANGHGIWSRLRQGDAMCISRLTLWRNVLQLIAAKPWTGWGWGELDYAHFMTLYAGPRFCDILDNAHNLPLHLAVELGVPLTVLLCGVPLLLVLRARPWREADGARQAGWTVLGLILLHSLLEYPLWYGPFQIALLLCLWLLRTNRNEIENPGAAQRVRQQTWEQLLGAGLLVLIAYAAWDYYRVSQIYLPPEQRAEAYRDHTLEKIRGSWLYSSQVRFAELSITPLTRDNAKQINSWAHQMLHYSPEARVVEKLIESAVMLGRDDEAKQFMVRYKAAYPKEYARWVTEQALGKREPGKP